MGTGLYRLTFPFSQVHYQRQMAFKREVIRFGQDTGSPGTDTAQFTGPVPNVHKSAIKADLSPIINLLSSQSGPTTQTNQGLFRLLETTLNVKPPGPGETQIVKIADQADSRIRATILTHRPKTGRNQPQITIWLDFKSLEHPVLKRLSEQLDFPLFQEKDDLADIDDDDSVILSEDTQLKAYDLQRDQASGDISPHLIHLYSGQNYFITAHNKSEANINSVNRQVTRRKAFLTPSDLLIDTISRVIRHNQKVIDTLYDDLDALSEEVLKEAPDGDAILVDLAKASEKIMGIQRVLIRQRVILADAEDKTQLLLDEAKRSDKKPSEIQELERISQRYQKLRAEISDQIKDIESHVARVYSLYEAKRSENSNHLDRMMKKMAAWTIILAFPAVIFGFFGMNTANLPFATVPLMSEYVAAGTISVNGFIFWLLKKYNWL